MFNVSLCWVENQGPLKKKKLIVDETSTYENYMLKALLSYCLACKKYVLAKI